MTRTRTAATPVKTSAKTSGTTSAKTPAKTSTKTPAKASGRIGAEPAPPFTPEDIKEFRAIADWALMPTACPQEECRRAKRCRGPLKVPDYGRDHAIPYCFAEALDGAYEPVHRWHTTWANLDAALAKLKGEAPARR